MKIYKITGYGLTYYGSTSLSLNLRKSLHKSNYKRFLDDKYHFITSFKILERGNEWNIEIVEDIDDINNLLVRERFYIDNNECINKCKPNRTIEDNREYYRNYYRNNKEKYLQYQINYINKKKEKIQGEILAI